MNNKLLHKWPCLTKLVYILILNLVIIIVTLMHTSTVHAQSNDECHINPFHAGRELYIEGTEGDMVYIVCIRLTYPHIRFETVMANDQLIINAATDQREAVASMTKREQYAIHNPIVAFNADYFGSGHGAEGLTVINGNRIDGPSNDDCDQKKFTDCHDNAIYRASLSISRLNAIEISHKGASEVTNRIVQLSRFYNSVGGGPILVRNGEVIENPCLVRSENVTDYNCSDIQQTAVGVSQDGKTMIVVVAESKTGEEMGNILLRYGAYNGMKLDGGGSSQLWFEGRSYLS